MGLSIDREKVIEGLRELRGSKETMKLISDTIKLLKEQEPVKPVNVRLEMGINGGNCPKCINWVQRSFNYCQFCGKEVKWE